MLLTLTTLSTGKAHWESRLKSYDNSTDVIEFSIDLYYRFLDSEALPHLSKRFEEAEFDWLSVVRGKIRIDADKARSDLSVLYENTPWFSGTLDASPEIHHGVGSTHISFTVSKQTIRSVTAFGGPFSMAANTSLFRRLVTWAPIISVAAWACVSYSWDATQTSANSLFGPSGAVVAIGGGWAEVWTWLWTRKSSNQPIHPNELTTAKIIGYAFVAIGSIIWAYGDRLV